MALEQRFIEGSEMGADEQYFDSLSILFSYDEREPVFQHSCEMLSTKIPYSNELNRMFASVVRIQEDRDVYFSCEYTKQYNNIPVLVDINPIDVDEFLDFYNDGLVV